MYLIAKVCSKKDFSFSAVVVCDASVPFTNTDTAACRCLIFLYPTFQQQPPIRHAVCTRAQIRLQVGILDSSSAGKC
jgi:hypothetical protein